MNISKATEHGYSNHALHHSGRFEKATVNVRGDNSQKVATSFGNSATKVTISPEAQALNETERPVSERPISIRLSSWLHEIQVEAIKNGTSVKTAVKEYGKEIAEYFFENDPDLLEGVIRYMDGQSFKDAFNLSERDCNYEYGNAVLEDKYFELDNILKRTREDYYDLKKRGIEWGVMYSFRYGSYISPPDKNTVQPDEEDKEDVSQDKNGDKAAPQDKNAIFKDFAERMVTSNRKKGIESTLRHHIKNERNASHKQERH
jgi:hypothetical protein